MLFKVRGSCVAWRTRGWYRNYLARRGAMQRQRNWYRWMSTSTLGHSWLWTPTGRVNIVL